MTLGLDKIVNLFGLFGLSDPEENNTAVPTWVYNTSPRTFYFKDKMGLKGVGHFILFEIETQTFEISRKADFHRHPDFSIF